MTETPSRIELDSELMHKCENPNCSHIIYRGKGMYRYGAGRFCDEFCAKENKVMVLSALKKKEYIQKPRAETHFWHKDGGTLLIIT